MWLPTKRGTTTTGTRRGWIFYWWRRTPTLQQHRTWCRRTSMACSSDARRVTLGSWRLAKCSTNGAPGSTASAAEGFWRGLSNRVSTQELPGGDLGQPGDRQELGPIGRFCGWLESQAAGTLQLGTACIDCGDSTRRVCWSCCAGLCSACFTWRQHRGQCGERRKMLSEL
jgi:hypothetical protein